MDSLQTLKLSNIQNLHNSIDNISRSGIEQKADLVKELNKKKQMLIEMIQENLKECRQVERVLFNQWSNQYNTEAYNKLEEYNLFIKQQHDKGSELIGVINGAKNFQQLNQVEIASVNPFINELKTKCSIYARHTSFSSPVSTSFSSLPVSSLPTVTNVPVRGVATDIKTTGMGKTDINVQHGDMGTSVDINKEEALGSPAHSVRVSGAKGPVKVTHQPSPQMIVPSPQPVRALSTIVPASPVRLVQPVRYVQPVAVSPVRVQPVRYVQPVQPVQQVRVVQPVQQVRVVQPVQQVRYVQPVQTVPVVTTLPVGARAIVTHTHIPSDRNGDKLAVEAGTVVRIEKYYGDWALVNTSTGQRGYVSRYYLRNI